MRDNKRNMKLGNEIKRATYNVLIPGDLRKLWIIF